MNASLHGASSRRASTGTPTVARDDGVDDRRTLAGGVLAAALPVALVLSVLVPGVVAAAAVALAVAAGSALVVGPE